MGELDADHPLSRDESVLGLLKSNNEFWNILNFSNISPKINPIVKQYSIGVA